MNCRKYNYITGFELDGLFKDYTNQGITQLTSFARVEASSTYSDVRGKPISLIDHNITGSEQRYNWISKNVVGSYFIIHLNTHQIKVSSYSLRMRTDHSSNIPVEWKVEGSNNLIDWNILHHRPRIDGLIEKGKLGHWTLNTTKYYRYFKFTQIGKNYNVNGEYHYVFSFNKVEFFGYICDPDINAFVMSCKTRPDTRFIILVFILLIS